MIKVSDFVADFVADQGVKDIFMLSGGGCMHLVDSFGKNEKLNYYCNLHEQACSIAAEAYAQHTNNLGVALVTTGPGGTNAVTGVAGAYIDSTPMLVISGQVKRADIKKTKALRQMGPQEIDIISIVESITKYAVTVMDPLKIKYHLEEAVYLAKSGRPGPVWIDIPLDIQGATVDPNQLESFQAPNENFDASDELIEKTVKLLKDSKRPVIMAGNGIRLAEAVSDFHALKESLDIPILLTWKTIDFLDENDPKYCGRPGTIAQRGANFTQQNSDLIITLGARLDCGQTAFTPSNFARAAKKVIVDADIEELNKLGIEIEVPAICDVKSFLQKINNKIKEEKITSKPEWSSWLKKSRDLSDKYPVIDKEVCKPQDIVNLYAFTEALSNQAKDDDLIVPGSSGACSEVILQAFKIKKGQRVQNTPGLGSMGFGLPASIGACIASGMKQTILINGEGGLQMNIQELETIQRHNLPIKLFVLQNNGYRSIVISQENFFNGRLVGSDPSSGVTVPSTMKLADAYGIKKYEIKNQQSLEKDIQTVLEMDGPVICDVYVNVDHLTLPKVKAKVNEDGSIVSMPMEDLYPYLSREEFMENMEIEPKKESIWE